MKQYLKQTKFSTKNLIRLIYKEEFKINQLKKNLENMRLLFQQLESKFLLEDQFDVHANHHYGQLKIWMNKKRKLMDKIALTEKSLVAKDFSVRSLSGALLQIAKQGISIKHQTLSSCPNGREIKAGLNLKDVIWNSRNQSLHFEDGEFFNYSFFYFF